MDHKREDRPPPPLARVMEVGRQQQQGVEKVGKGGKRREKDGKGGKRREKEGKGGEMLQTTQLQAVKLSQRLQTAVQIVSKLPVPSNGDPIYLDGGRCSSHKEGKGGKGREKEGKGGKRRERGGKIMENKGN